MKNSISTTMRWFYGTLVVFVVCAGFALVLFSVVRDEASRSAVRESSIVETGTPGAPQVELAVVALDGNWSAEDNGVTFAAVISSKTIQIMFINDGTSMIYWNGTFQDQENPGANVQSDKIDIDKIVLSGAVSKDFQISADTISFQFEAMGMTKTVVMTRA